MAMAPRAGTRSVSGGMELSVASNIKQFEKGLSDLERKQMPFVIAVSLTRTTKDIQKNTEKQMRRRLDRPKAYTMRALATKAATKRDLTSRVFFREFAGKGIAAGKYLKVLETGGPRAAKRSEIALRKAGIMARDEFWVPAKGTRLNQYGNIPAGLMSKILSQLKASSDGHQNETATSRRRKSNRATRYFVPAKGSKLPRGVWQRRGKKIKPVLIFVTGVRYRKMLKFFDGAEKTARAQFPVHFRREFAKAIATAWR